MARIGLRNLKTALAVFVCMVISKLLKLEFPFFVVVAAIISMENSLMNSFKAGRSRMVGTIIGAGLGLICALISPGSALMSAIGMVVVIYLCNFLKWHKPIPIAGIVFMAVMVSLSGKNPLFYSINRIIDTLIGIVVAVAVNYFVFPPDYLPRIRRQLPELLTKTEQFFHQILIGHKNVSLVEYEGEIVKANELWELSRDDSKLRQRKNIGEISDIRHTLDKLGEIYRHLRIIAQMNRVSGLNQLNAYEIPKIFQWNDLPRQVSAENETSIVFNYHVRKVLELYQNIKNLE